MAGLVGIPSVPQSSQRHGTSAAGVVRLIAPPHSRQRRSPARASNRDEPVELARSADWPAPIVARRVVRVDDQRRSETGDGVDRRLRALVGRLALVDREALEQPATRLGREHVADQRRLARSRRRDDREGALAGTRRPRIGGCGRVLLRSGWRRWRGRARAWRAGGRGRGEHRRRAGRSAGAVRRLVHRRARSMIQSAAAMRSGWCSTTTTVLPVAVSPSSTATSRARSAGCSRWSARPAGRGHRPRPCQLAGEADPLGLAAGEAR